MRGKKYVGLMAALAVSAAAIVIPEQIMNKTIDQSFGKAVKAGKIADDGKVAVLNKDEAYKLTSLMMQGKLTARKEFIKKVPYNEFYKQFSDFNKMYADTRIKFEKENMYPMVTSGENMYPMVTSGENIYPMVTSEENIVYRYRYIKDSDILDMEIELDNPIVSLYQYKENIFYNFETSIWEVKWTDQYSVLTYSIQIDENLRAYQTELKVNLPKKGLELQEIHLTKKDIEPYLKTIGFDITDVKEEKELSPGKQRFIVETGRNGQQYHLDVTSTKTLFHMEMNAVAEE